MNGTGAGQLMSNRCTELVIRGTVETNWLGSRQTKQKCQAEQALVTRKQAGINYIKTQKKI